MKYTNKHKHLTDCVEPSDNYNNRLTEGAPEASPAGKLDAAIPIDPRANVVIAEKDGVNYFTGCDTQTPETVLNIIDSHAGHEAINHAVYVETSEDARRLFAALIETQCLIETVVSIYYKEHSGFVAFEPAEESTHPNQHPNSAVQRFIERYTDRVDEHTGPDNETDTETQPKTATERTTKIETEVLFGYLRCWIANTTPDTPPCDTTLDRLLSGVDGLETDTRNSRNGRQNYCRLSKGVWNFD